MSHHLDPVFTHATDDEGLGIASTAYRSHARLVTEQVGNVAHRLLFNLPGRDHSDGTGNIFQFLLHP